MNSGQAFDITAEAMQWYGRMGSATRWAFAALAAWITGLVIYRSLNGPLSVLGGLEIGLGIIVAACSGLMAAYALRPGPVRLTIFRDAVQFEYANGHSLTAHRHIAAQVLEFHVPLPPGDRAETAGRTRTRLLPFVKFRRHLVAVSPEALGALRDWMAAAGFASNERIVKSVGAAWKVIRYIPSGVPGSTL